ncbi:phosphodiester glycosidase family protein [Rhizobium sp. GN54]|uniref:phosphodiester glycosidase family protein n=1 Tax=Rhizobium sp. GN54 TaxID=2898150 RepID=UPI001E2D1775|nr:phosphodiester glycosidase family protein [Rhizobium sp. GN54]MCD2181950.1 phosphodiester glycosidase family protein [Rhizobium sp. GN54]
MKRLFGLALAASSLVAGSASAACEEVLHLADSYIVCRFDPARETIRVYGAAEGAKEPLTYWAVRDILREDREFLVFGMNGGMYHPGYSPVGLLVEYGRERHPLNREAGEGNFFLKPNGVFFVGKGTAAVMETEAFARARPEVQFATQSGPMLVEDGRIHPRFLPDSDSLYVRNGVGILPDGRVAFAISRGAVRFHDFATLFRDALGCRDALFLDGSISSLYAPEVRRNDRFSRMGTVIAVTGGLPY